MSNLSGGTALDETTVRIVSGVLAVLCVIIIIWRRKAKKNASRDDL
jgi:hypothetical protein